MELILTLILATSATAVVGPSGVELERMIDTSVQLPGTTAQTVFDSLPLPCGEGVVFPAFENTLQPRGGVYYVSPTALLLVADEETPIPNSAGTFLDIKEVDCVGNQVVFLGSEGDGANRLWSAYRWSLGGHIELIQEKGVQIDGREVESFLELSANHFGVGMLGRLTFATPGEVLVVKPYKDEPIIVADTSTILPGQTEPVTIYSLPFLVGQDLLFRARTFLNLGLYRWSAGQGISVVVDHQTAVPSSIGTFASFGNMVLLADGLAFEATYSEGLGIFIDKKSGQIEPLVVPGDLTEDGETITSAYFPSGAGGLLSFTGRTVEHPLESVFARTDDGKVHRILGTGDVIEGQQVVLTNAQADAFSVAIRVSTGDPLSEIIYRARFFAPAADIPALSEVGVVVLVVGLILAGLLLLRSRLPIRDRGESSGGA